MTTEVKVYQLELVGGEGRFPAKLAGWIRAIYRWLAGQAMERQEVGQRSAAGVAVTPPF